MSTALLISIILNGILILAIIWIAFELSIIKLAGTYQKEIADLYKNRVESLNNSYDEMSRIAQEAIDSYNNITDIAKYTQYKLEHCIKAIRYAEHFLKPRKKQEMYNILSHFLSFDGWKKTQKELEEMADLKKKLDNE